MRTTKSLQDISRELGLAQTEVERLVDSGALTAARVGGRLLFTDKDVDTFLQSRGSLGFGQAHSSSRRKGAWGAAAAAAVLLGASSLWAAFPGASEIEGLPVAVPFAGILDADGAPSNGVVAMTFELFDAETGGTSLWTSGEREVDVDAGQFSVVLGTQTALPPRIFIDNPDTYLSVSIAGEPLNGRQALAPTPYALRAAYASAADDFDVSGEMRATDADIGTLVANGVTTSTLSSGTISVTGALSASSAGITNTLTASNITVVNTVQADHVRAETADFTQGDRFGTTNGGGAQVPGAQFEFRWGRVTSNSDETQTFTYNRSFGSTCIGVWVNRNANNTENSFDAVSCNRFGFSLNRANTTDGSQTLTYLAVGY